MLGLRVLLDPVGCTGIEPVTSCLSSMRSEPTELTPLQAGKVMKNYDYLYALLV